ncbi:MAG: hypothetical protein EAZ95_03320 [Bacteroidetes bacterium]|nr:MAG: hypothetical protein EAZ95_03320 [Bacteroidota bacterium]
MKKLSKLTLALFCAIFLVAITDAQAQKKPKLKGLAKQIIGTWSFDDLDAKLDESKADDMMKQQFPMFKSMIGAEKGTMKDRVFFIFNPDGTYINKSTLDDGKIDEKKGTWAMEGNTLNLKPEVVQNDMPTSFKTSFADKKLQLEAPFKEGAPIIMIMKLVKKS